MPVWTVTPPGPCNGLDSEPRMCPTLALLPTPSWAGPQSAETQGLRASPLLPALMLIPLQWHMELPSGLLSLWTRTHSPGVPHQPCFCSPWEAPSCRVGGPGADVDTGQEAAGVPRGSLLPYPVSTVSPVMLPLQSRGWGPRPLTALTWRVLSCPRDAPVLPGGLCTHQPACTPQLCILPGALWG